MKTYQHIIHYEEMVSRIPGLFPYIITNDGYNVGGICNAMTNEDGCGCWGQYPTDLTYNGITYSYRTLMNLYYSKNIDNNLKEFIEKGIGKVSLKKQTNWLKDKNINVFNESWFVKHNKAPEAIYLANINKLIEKYQTLHNTLICYKNNRNEDIITEKRSDYTFPDNHICCLWLEYCEIGGDSLLSWLYNLKPLAYEIAMEYLNYSAGSAKTNISVILSSSVNDMGCLEQYINRWIAGNKYQSGEMVVYYNAEKNTDEVYICKGGKIGEVVEDSSGIYNSQTDSLEFPFNVFEPIVTKNNDTIKINGRSYSKLTNLKRYISPTSTLTNRKPNIDEDWLIYYKKGLVTNINVTCDTLGNIFVQDDIRVEKGYEKNLMAFGDVMLDIERNTKDRTLTFTYVIGAHLKAEVKEVEMDDDNNKLYKYGYYEYDDENKLQGVVYKETFGYGVDSDIDKLTDDEFNKLIDINNDIFTIKTYPFSTETNKETITGEYDGKELEYDEIIANYSSLTTFEKDYLETPLIRTDTLFAISYRPNLDIDIYINRGNAAAFEKHMKLGEINTFEDLENYSNGSFFNLQDPS